MKRYVQDKNRGSYQEAQRNARMYPLDKNPVLGGEMWESIEEHGHDLMFGADSYSVGLAAGMRLADFECEHDRLPGDGTPICGCWPSELPTMMEDLMTGVKKWTRAQVIGFFNVAMQSDVISEFEVEAEGTNVKVTVSNEFGTRSYLLPPTGGTLAPTAPGKAA